MLIYLQMLETPEERTLFERLYITYRDLMYQIALKVLHNEQDAEDAVHQAFLSILKNIRKFAEVECSETRRLIVVITERKSIDIFRARTRRSVLPYEDELYGVEVSIPEEHGLAHAMAQLPARYREVLQLRFGLGLTTKEIGELFDMTQESVQKLVWRAKQSLQKQLEKDGERIE